MALNFSSGDDLTAEAFENPQVGDLFTEMLAYWVYVVAREGDTITTMEGSAPCVFPTDGLFTVSTLEEFRSRYAYRSIPGYWVRLHSRGNDISGCIPVG